MSVTPILYVEDVPSSSKQLQLLFDWTSQHGGPDFEMLGDQEGTIVLYLHRKDIGHDHGALNPVEGPVGNGVNFYIKVENLDVSYERAQSVGVEITVRPHLNPGSRQREFALRDQNGFHFVITTWG